MTPVNVHRPLTRTLSQVRVRLPHAPFMFVLTDTDARPKGARRRDRDWVTKNMLKSKALRRGAIATVELRTNHASLEGEIIKQYEELFQLVSVPTPRRCVIAVGSQHWALNPRTHAGRPDTCRLSSKRLSRASCTSEAAVACSAVGVEAGRLRGASIGVVSLAQRVYGQGIPVVTSACGASHAAERLRTRLDVRYRHHSSDEPR